MTEPENVQQQGRQELSAVSGKRRRGTGIRRSGKSRFSALRSGLYAEHVILPWESRAEFDKLLADYIAFFRPVGRPALLKVEELAITAWKIRRVLQSERAEILEAIEFDHWNSLLKRKEEFWDLARAGETSGGMLRVSSNPFIIQESINQLRIVHEQLKEGGFKSGEDPWRLRSVFGLNQDGTAPSGIFESYMVYSKLAEQFQAAGNHVAAEELKTEMLKILKQEIDRLSLLVRAQQIMDERVSEYKRIEALSLPQEPWERTSERLTYLYRQYDRILSELKTLQQWDCERTIPKLKVEVESPND